MIFDRRSTYLSMIENSVGTKMFQSCFFKKVNTDWSVSSDVCDEGRLSCAFHVSGILKMMDLVRVMCVTVGGLERELNNTGWRECIVYPLEIGDVIFWEAMKNSDGKEHRHCGFYVKINDMGTEIYVSNLDKGINGNVPHEHTKDYWCERRIEKVYRHPFFI